MLASRLCLGLLALTSILQLHPLPVRGAMTDPSPFRFQQPNGELTPEIFLRGGPGRNYMADVNGYTVIQDHRSTLVYANKNQTNGNLVPSGILVGRGDPARHGIPPGLGQAATISRKLDSRPQHPSGVGQSRTLSTPSLLKNLVILIRFADHSHRTLPTETDIDTLFNQVGGHPTIAPTGSVRDVFEANSYGKFTLESHVHGWIALPESEAYYANGVSGFRTDQFLEALHYALNQLDSQHGVDFSTYDADGDNFVDMVTLLHSGYAAEVAGVDVDGNPTENRIWSHRWLLPSSKFWTSTSGVHVNQYSTSPSLWSLSGSNIGRIGVICHEIGHSLPTGLPDLYGTMAGNGIGSYDFMSNHWGFGPYESRQHYPPMLSPWTKVKAGWLEPILIESSGSFAIPASAIDDTVYQINLGEDGTEYLLIENRQPLSFDAYLPQGGLAIWHIDELAPDVEGYPGQPGPWPENGKHYKVSLLQADGKYALEQGLDHGEKGDLFHGDGVSWLGPSHNLQDGPFPNTDAYQDGDVRYTGVQIFDITTSGNTMYFSVALEAEEYAMGELQTTFFANNGAAGNMFDILPNKDITVHRLDLHIEGPGPTMVEIFVKVGTHESFEQNLMAWNRLDPVSIDVEGNGPGIRISLEVNPILLSGGQLHAIYITLLSGKLRYTNGVGVGSVVASNNDLMVFEGVGKAGFFGTSYPNRIWNGAIHYSYHSEMLATLAPTSAPTFSARRLGTTFAGGSGQAGNMFDLLAYQDILVTGFDVHVSDHDEITVEVLTKPGSFVASRNSCADWEVVSSQTLKGAGSGVPSTVALEDTDAVFVPKGHIQAFYITVIEGSAMKYTPGQGTDSLVVRDEYLAIFEGAGVAYRCGPTFWDRIWNGGVHYVPIGTP